MTLSTVNRPKNQVGFVVLPRRWVVERPFAWIMHARRHAPTTNGSSSMPRAF